MHTETLFIESKDKTLLETYVSCVNTREEQTTAPGILIAHPYGPLGGSMHNNVVMSIQRHFLHLGYVTICINFRGCGKSQGKTSWTGMSEREDYISVMEYCLSLPNYPKINHLILCGYSFGAMIANSIPPYPQIPCAYLLISQPLGVMWALATTRASYFKKLQPVEKVLSVHGDHDQFTSLKTFTNWSCSSNNVTHVTIPGADHFWVNDEVLLIQTIENWRQKEL